MPSRKGQGHRKREVRSSSAAGAPESPALGARVTQAESDRLQKALRLISKEGPKHAAPLLELLRGPQAGRLVAADRAAGDAILFTATQCDLPELLLRRLEVGGDVRMPLGVQAANRISSLLHLAVSCLAPACLEAVLGLGAVDPNGTDRSGMTPLHFLSVCMLGTLNQGLRHPARLTLPRGEQLRLVRRMAEILRDGGADFSLRGPPTPPALRGHCCVVNAIDNGLLEVAVILIDTFTCPGRHLHKGAMQAYVTAAMRMERKEYPHKPSPEAVDALYKSMTYAWRPPAGQETEFAFALLPELGRAMLPPGVHEPLEVISMLKFAVEHGAARTAVWLCEAAKADAVRRKRLPAEPPLPHLLLQHDAHGCVGPLAACSADIDMAECDARGLNALYCACKDNRTAFVAALCEHVKGPALLRLLEGRDPAEGITSLGYSVAWGYAAELRLLLRACRAAGLGVSRLLERHKPVSNHHMPAFTPVVHQYPILEELLEAGLDPRSAACTEHVAVASNGDATFLREQGERTETVSLLMCAASTGNLAAVKLLLAAGADARRAPAGNSRFIDAVTVVLRGLQLEQPLTQSRPDADFAAAAEPWLRTWDAVALGVGTPQPADGEAGSDAVDEWVLEWEGEDPGARFACLLWLLWAGAALTRGQLGELLVLINSQDGACQEADALENFLYERLKPCSCCSLLGRWRRCACKRVWYCGRACQKQHWQAGHERNCPHAPQLRAK